MPVFVFSFFYWAGGFAFLIWFVKASLKSPMADLFSLYYATIAIFCCEICLWQTVKNGLRETLSLKKTLAKLEQEDLSSSS